MSEPYEAGGINGVDDSNKPSSQRKETLYGLLYNMIAIIVIPDPGSPLLRRIKNSLSENLPLLRKASRNTGRDILSWTRKGSALRALLVISVGTITLLSLTGLLVFMLFFLAATTNAIIISLLMSLAAVGGFLALFFACMTAVYIGALSIAAFAISTATISAIIAVLIAAGWIGFFWSVWLVIKKSVGVAKHSFSVTGSAISAYSSGRRAHHHHERHKFSD